jgi:hypothetical protein
MDGGLVMAWTEIYRDSDKWVEQDETGAQRVTYANPNEDTIRKAARQALVVNRTFLDLAAPTNAQTLAQVKHLTRVANGLLRIELSDFTSAD